MKLHLISLAVLTLFWTLVVQESYCQSEIESCSAPASPVSSECLIKGSNLNSWLQIATPTVIEYRKPEQFNSINIESSINQSLLALKYRKDLHTQRILLISQEYEYESLNKACQELAKQGFQSIKALVGGIPSAANAALKLVGPGPKTHWPISLEPLQLFSEFSNSNPLLAFEKLPEIEISSKLPGEVSEISKSHSLQDQTENLLTLVKTAKELMPLRAVIFIPDSGTSANYWIQAFDKRKHTQEFYFLKSGLDGLKIFIKQSKQIQDAANYKRARCQ